MHPDGLSDELARLEHLSLERLYVLLQRCEAAIAADTGLIEDYVAFVLLRKELARRAASEKEATVNRA